MKIIYCTHSTCNPGDGTSAPEQGYLPFTTSWMEGGCGNYRPAPAPSFLSVSGEGTHDRFGNQLLGG